MRSAIFASLLDGVNDIRLDTFHQLKKGIRDSQKDLIARIDAATEKYNTFFGTERGKALQCGF